MKKLLLIAAAMIALTSQAQAINLITNGGFETGSLSGWTVDPFSLGNVQVSAYNGIYCCQGALPPEGTFAAAFGGGGNVTGEIAQAFPTVAGRTYTGSVQYAGVGGPNDGNIQISVGDAVNLTVLSTSGPLQPAFNGTWSTYNFSFVATSAQSGIDIISPNGPGTDYNLDNVQVVPEPTSLILFGVGAMVLGFAARRRRHA